ncbi:MAG: SIMPL domain-containing protein [Bacteroidota bacterium]
MKKLFFLSLILFSSFTFSQTKNYLDKPYYQTAASADTLVTPDRIFININISESDTKGKISIEQLERKMYNALKSIGIDTDEYLKVNDMSSNYKKYILKKKDILKDKSFSLQVDNAKTLTNVFVSLEKIGISNTSIQKVEYSKQEEMQFLMKQKALLKAKTEAKLLTQSIGQNIGKAIFISSENYIRNYAKGNYQMEMKAYSTTDAAPLDIDFKKIKISSTINVIFELN